MEDALAAGALERDDHCDRDHRGAIEYLMEASILIFFVLSGLLVVASLMVVFLRNVVHCAMALVAALFIIAIFFVTLQAPMVGVLQVLVYAGAIMVLFLFVIMFLNPTLAEQRWSVSWSLGTLLALLFGGLLVPLLSKSQSAREPVASTELFGSPEMLAKSLFNDFVLPFEIASVLLLVAIVGAVVLAKRER
jgi:NADH-quinone oxidoreductase subunit J